MLEILFFHKNSSWQTTWLTNKHSFFFTWKLSTWKKKIIIFGSKTTICTKKLYFLQFFNWIPWIFSTKNGHKSVPCVDHPLTIPNPEKSVIVHIIAAFIEKFCFNNLSNVSTTTSLNNFNSFMRGLRYTFKFLVGRFHQESKESSTWMLFSLI